MFGKVCKITYYREEIECILVGLKKSGAEMLAQVVYIDELVPPNKLRTGFIFLSNDDVQLIEVLNKTPVEYFDLIFSGNVDQSDMYDFAQEWK